MTNKVMCPICGTINCDRHPGIKEEIFRVKKELKVASPERSDNDYAIRALNLYQELSEEGRENLQLLIAAILTNLKYTADLNGKPTRLGPIGVLELLVSLIQVGAL